MPLARWRLNEKLNVTSQHILKRKLIDFYYFKMLILVRHFRLRNNSAIIFEYSVESLQSHMILTMSHWSSGLPVCFPLQGTQDQISWGGLM